MLLSIVIILKRELEKQQRQEGQPQKQNFQKDIIKINTF